MVDKNQQSRSITRRRTRHEPGKVEQLGDTLNELMKNRIVPLQARFSPVAQLWEQMLPEELRQHCEIIGVSCGRLKVSVDSPSYMYELRLCRSELLGQLRRQCPRARIEQIEFITG